MVLSSVKRLGIGMGGLLIGVAAGAAVAAGPVFTGDELKQMSAYKAQFNRVKNQAQLLAVYRQGLKLGEKLAPRLDAYMQGFEKEGRYPDEDALAQLGARVPGLAPRLVAEGTALVLYADYAAFARLASWTPEPADNAFFALMQQAYGPSYHHFGAWFSQTWDYGGCTLLGSGRHRRLFQGIRALRAARSPFAPELAGLERELTADLQQSSSFCQPKAHALQEFSQLIPLAPAAARPGLQQRLKQLQTGQSPDRAFEFDCAGKGQCNYGA